MGLHHERIQTAAPILQPKLAAFLDRTEKAGYQVLVVRCWDSTQAQWLKFQQGRELDRATGVWEVTEPAKVITNALPGQSAHNLVDQAGRPASMAIDIIPLDRQGRPLWGLPGESDAQLELRWQQATGRAQAVAWDDLYRIAGRCGLDAYGDAWGAFMPSDKGHFEEPAYKLIVPVLGLSQPTWTMPAQT